MCSSDLAGLNRGVPTDHSTEIMGGIFRRGLNSEGVTFSTRLAVQAPPQYKSDWEKARWQLPIFASCLLIVPNGFTPLFSTRSMVYIST